MIFRSLKSSFYLYTIHKYLERYIKKRTGGDFMKNPVNKLNDTELEAYLALYGRIININDESKKQKKKQKNENK